MQYKVIPFKADIVRGEGQDKAATQLESLINANAREGWNYIRLESIQTVITTPGSPAVPGTNGCMGLGATPGIAAVPDRRDVAEVYVAVFQMAQ